jgi:molybdenum cofactor cytidylyltransferase/nicotine blue oxidoreductase
MGRPKAELELGGRRLVDRAVEVLRAGGCDPVIAVVREGMSVEQAVAVVNQHPERGMRSSLALAVQGATGADALAVVLVDAPGVGPQAVRWTITAWRAGRIAMATFGGVRGHPIVMSPVMWQDALAMAEPDEGARSYLAANHHLVDLVPVPGDPSDVDRPEDLVRWQRQGNRPPHRRE